MSAASERQQPGLMSSRSRYVRPLMEPDPDLPAWEWSSHGVASLWVVALTLALVLWIGLLAQN